MNTREQFGKYLLLKKLTEDPLGETFRAGMLGANGMERVALLRVMNGQGLNGQRLWQETKDRAGLQPLLRSPNLGEGIEMGQVQGIPYVAYDYVSGKNLATLLEQAAVKRNFIPAEHALLITERIALGLASASEQRLGGERILHGFLVPHLVMISNEGETRLLGFEVAPALRAFAANPVTRQHFGRYLAPEALAGSPPHPADDIYSLGVLLLELLTGKPLPPPAPDGFGTIIDQSVVATEGTPIPADLATLLKTSLVARDHRMGDVVTWHKTLNKWMFDGQYNPTTFNLAFFMHNLFRQEIERESQEIEVEKTLPLPIAQGTASGVVPTGAAATAAAATGAVAADAAAAGAPAAAAPPTGEVPTAAPVAAPAADGTGVREATDVREVTAAVPVQKKSKAGLIGALAAALVLLLGAGGYFWWQGQQNTDSTSAAATQPATPAPAPIEPEPEVPAGPTPDEISEQIRALVGERATEMEEALRSQYDKQLSDLQKQLEVAKAEAEARRQREAEAQAAAEQQAREEQAAKEAEAARIAQEEADAAAAAEAKKKAEEEAAAKVAAAAPPPVAPAPPPPAAPPAASQVRRGDLVSLGPGVVPPKLLRRPAPRFPIMAKRLNKKEAKVLLRVLIDENGKVIKAELAGKEAGFGFDDEAMSAARKSTYNPATKDGIPVKFWHTLAVEFRDK